MSCLHLVDSPRGKQAKVCSAVEHQLQERNNGT
jgi:hypothetical protein